MTTYPQITITNTLPQPLTVYDAFNDDPADKSLANFFGALTSIGSVTAGGTATITPIHGPVSVYIVYGADNAPIKRVFTLGSAPQSFDVAQADLDVMAATQNFVALMASKPDDPDVVRFKALLKGGAAKSKDVDAFFQGTADHKSCTFISYMLVAVTLARTPATKSLPPEQQAYSLAALLTAMEIDWPDGLPDIAVSKFYCSEADDRVTLGGVLNLRDVTFADGVLDRATSILPGSTVRFSVVVVYEPGLAVGTTQLRCVFDTLSIPVGGDDTVKLGTPTVSLSITPLFKFVVFEIEATIPFTLFGSPTFDAVVAMTIDNAEAEIGVTLDGDGHTLLTPPGIKGLHFDSVGVGMGLFFEPPGFALGVQGKFHIGEGAQAVELDDDTFAVVCTLEEEVPNPLFLAFSVPKMTLAEVVTVFTDAPCLIDFPIGFSDLSFHWAENPMEPVTLPDGTLAPMGYGFRGAMDLFGLGFYADLALDMSAGVKGRADLDPFALGPVLSLTGDGPGVTIKVDAAGDPIPNNTIPQTAAAKQAIAQATTRQLVRPGGAELQIDLLSSPFFTLDAKLAFLDFRGAIDASIDKGGIHFSLDFGATISGQMTCVLEDFHNFTGTFTYGPDFDVPLPTVGGVDLGSISLTAQVATTLTLTTSATDVAFTAACTFTFEGEQCQAGPVGLDVDISALTGVLSAIEGWVKSNAGAVFGTFVADAARWARAIYRGAIRPAEQGVQYVTNTLKNGFGKSVSDMGDLLKGSSYAAGDVASALKTTFGASANDVAGALSSAYGVSADAASQALAQAGYAADDIASAIGSVFHTHADTSVHIDTSGGPHVDTNGPHIDVPSGPHVDTAFVPHLDTSATHVDVPSSPHVDTAFVPHLDTGGIHGDVPSSPHVDTGGDHTDAHQDRWGWDTHEDTSIPHLDTGTPHGDTSTPHVDTPQEAHVDTQTPHGDTSTPHVDTPETAHVDNRTPHVDTNPHVDAQVPPPVSIPGQHIDVQT